MKTEVLDQYISDPNELKLVSPSSLQGVPIPKREWLIEGLIPKGYTTALYGDGGTGKSLLAMQIMTCHALGYDFFGKETMPVKAIGFFCEDDQNELHIRQSEINEYYGCSFSDLVNLEWISRVAENNIFMDFDNGSMGELTDIFHKFENTILKFGARLVVVDTAADTFGGNEILRPQVRQYIVRCLNRLARKIDGAVILCAHPSASGRDSGRGDGGSTAWNNSVRSRLYFERPKVDDDFLTDEGDKRILSKKKSNYSKLDEPIEMVYRNGAFTPFALGGNDFVDRLGKKNREWHIEECFLKAMDDFEKQGRNLSENSKSGSNYAPKMMMTNSKCTEFSCKELKKAMERLFDQGKIKIEEYGRPSRPNKKIVRTDLGA